MQLSMNDYLPGELEHCVLSVIWRIQPCTAYQVRREFQTSLTTSWRASTGSIYPLLRKLSEHRFVRQTEVPGDKRRSRTLQISETGIRSLEAWLQDSASWIAEPVADPIRTRSYVLPLLHRRAAKRVVSHWKKATEETLKEIEARLEEHRDEGDKVQQWVHRGTRLQLIARLEWLTGLLDELI
jgi:DNA-binding PadR family transcriptional regulator